MRIEIELYTTAQTAMEDKPLRVRCEYDAVRITDTFTGRPVEESAETFLQRPFLERYKIIRDGRAQLLKHGEPISIDAALSDARQAFDASQAASNG